MSARYRSYFGDDLWVGREVQKIKEMVPVLVHAKDPQVEAAWRGFSEQQGCNFLMVNADTVECFAKWLELED